MKCWLSRTLKKKHVMLWHFDWIHLFFSERCGRFPPVVKTAVPVDGRFEHIVLSCNATSDHAIIWIEKEAKRALEVSFIFLPSLLCWVFDFQWNFGRHPFAFLYPTFSFVVLLCLPLVVYEVEDQILLRHVHENCRNKILILLGWIDSIYPFPYLLLDVN